MAPILTRSFDPPPGRLLEQAPCGCPELRAPAAIEAVRERGAKAGDIGLVENQPARALKPCFERAVLALRVRALPLCMPLDRAADDLLQIFRHAPPEREARDEVETGPHVAGEAHVAAYLVKPVHFGDDERVFLAVHLALGQSCVELADIDDHRLRPER